MKTILIADSGSTKTNWALCQSGQAVTVVQTQGINPYQLSESQIADILRKELLPQLGEAHVDEVYFYGAGQREEMREMMTKLLTEVLGVSFAEVQSDLVGAARALCGKDEGIACILGTGANSCVFDGKEIVRQVSPLGFILGDEGSGAAIGKRLVGDVLKSQLPDDICQAFFQETPHTADDIIRNVYRNTFPNRFLAQYTHFVSRHISHPAVEELVTSEFVRFFRRNIANYNRPDLEVNFVGSVAEVFMPQLKQAAKRCGFRIGRVMKDPMNALVCYHLQNH